MRQQPPAFHCHKQMHNVVCVLWASTTLCCVWFIVLVSYTAHEYPADTLDTASYWIPIYMHLQAPFIPFMDASEGTDTQNRTFSTRDFAWLFVLLCTLQSLVTSTLHVAELLVNCCRDEANWRRASSPQGSQRTSNALVALLTSYPSLILFCLKPFTHWIYGLSFAIDVYNGVYFYAPQILYLTLTILLLTAFASFLTFSKYKGSQPVAFGHLQTLVDLIDVWPERKDRMYWGDKGIVKTRDNDAAPDNQDGVRCAGTYWHSLPAIQLDKMYV